MESARREELGDRDQVGEVPAEMDEAPDDLGNEDRPREFTTSDGVGVRDPKVTDEDEPSIESSRVPEPDSMEPLLPTQDEERFRVEWKTIQAGFVDEPRRSVKDADRLVAELMHRLSESFSDARGDLERQWDRGDDVSTDDLRLALQRYRSFFNRLLAA
jgi:hypothetical protein